MTVGHDDVAEVKAGCRGHAIKGIGRVNVTRSLMAVVFRQGNLVRRKNPVPVARGFTGDTSVRVVAWIRRILWDMVASNVADRQSNLAQAAFDPS